ncbi:LysR family transcriptional regulator [Craterilacuibacter sp.]|uniref:LysR family transcriptional regulator n=1 Tax=Craterilacuibacter sp. TaxID=2870909 RepID=UPI003F3540A4
MRITLREMEVFAAVASAGGVTRAAVTLALTQSAASQSLDKLEASLGSRLFDRVGRRLVLNEHGRILLPRARALLDAARDVEGLFQGEGGWLKLGASTTIANYLMPAKLAAFRRTYPAVQLEMKVANTRDIVAAVLAFEVDCAFVEGPCHHPELLVLPWREDELVLFVGAGHRLAGRVLTLEELAGAPWILREAGSGTREEVERLLLPHLPGLNLEMELGDSEAIKRSVAAGLGVSCLSREVVAEWLADGRLVELKAPLPALQRTLWQVQQRERVATCSLQLFLSLL